jgi:hypothetical protein
MRRFRVLMPALLGAALLAAGCAAPYKLLPPFFSQADKIKRIGVYPLIYVQDGKNERLLGISFNQIFMDGVTKIPMKPGVTVAGPDTVLARLARGGLMVADSVMLPSMLGVRFPVYRYPSDDAYRALAGSFDAFLVPTLQSYHEVEAGTQAAEMCATSCLTGGMFTASEENSISLEFDLLAVASKQSLWTYTFASNGGLGIQRVKYSNKALEGISKYLPFSAAFKGK